MSFLANRVRLYWPLIKSTQTGLLLATGIAGYLSTGTHIQAGSAARAFAHALPRHQRLDHPQHVVRPRH